MPRPPEPQMPRPLGEGCNILAHAYNVKGHMIGAITRASSYDHHCRGAVLNFLEDSGLSYVYCLTSHMNLRLGHRLGILLRLREF